MLIIQFSLMLMNLEFICFALSIGSIDDYSQWIKHYFCFE